MILQYFTTNKLIQAYPSTRFGDLKKVNTTIHIPFSYILPLTSVYSNIHFQLVIYFQFYGFFTMTGDHILSKL